MKEKNEDNQTNIEKELFSLIEFAKWELNNFNLLKKTSKIIKSELILIDKDTLKKWKEKSCYNIFKKQIFNYLFALNKIKNQKEKINQENININKKWNKMLLEKKINLNDIKSLNKIDLSGIYLSLKEKKINAYKNYEIVSSKLYHIFQPFINYKITVEGFYNKGKLIIPLNYKNEMSLRTSIKSDENFLEIIFLNNKNESEDWICILPNDNSICKQIENFYINETIENLNTNIFNTIEPKDNNKKELYFSSENGDKIKYRIINKKNVNSSHSKISDNFNMENIINLKQDNHIEKNNGKDLEKLRLILSQKIKNLQEINQRINQRNNNILKLQTNPDKGTDNINSNNNEYEKKLKEIKNKCLKAENEYKMKQIELTKEKKNLNDKEKIFKNYINELKLKEEQDNKDLMLFENNDDLSKSKKNYENNYLIKEKKLKNKEELLNKREKEIKKKELNLKDKEIMINKEKLELSKKEKELDEKLEEINEKLIYMKNKNYLMNIKESDEKEINIEEKEEENDSHKELSEKVNDLDEKITLQNQTITKENKIKKINISKNISNNYKTLNSISYKNRSPDIISKKFNKFNKFNLSPENNKLKKNILFQSINNNNESNSINNERRISNFNFKRAKTLTNENNNFKFNNNTLSLKINNNKLKLNPNVKQTETKINKNAMSLGLEETERPNNINPVLQCLAHIPELAEGILELGYKKKIFKENNNIELTRNFASIVNNIFFPLKYNNDEIIYCPINFVSTFIQTCPLINEEDVPIYFNTYDMVKFILETFHEQLNIKKDNINNDIKDEPINISDEKNVLVNFLTKFTNNNNSLISKLFYGLIKSKCICNGCGNNQFYFDYYSYLYFDLPKIFKYVMDNKILNKKRSILNLYDCFDYQRREINLNPFTNDINTSILEIFNINSKSGKTFCDNCQNESSCKLYNCLYSSNTILTIILERGDDNNYFIEDFKFPEELNLENYVEINKNVKKYYLCGVVSNLGRNNSFGRFIAYCRMINKGKWFSYENEKRKLCYINDVYKNGIPYMLIYHKV